MRIASFLLVLVLVGCGGGSEPNTQGPKTGLDGYRFPPFDSLVNPKQDGEDVLVDEKGSCYLDHSKKKLDACPEELKAPEMAAKCHDKLIKKRKDQCQCEVYSDPPYIGEVPCPAPAAAPKSSGGFGSGSSSTPAPEPAKITMGDPAVKGAYPADIIKRVVRQNTGKLRLCYEDAHDVKLSGDVKITFGIGKDGKVASTKDGGSSLKDKGAIDCMLKAMKEADLTFPKVEAPFTFDLSVTFTPAN